MKVKLLEIEEDDLEMIRDWRNSPEVAKYMFTDNFIEQGQQAAWFESTKTDIHNHFWIIEFDGEKVGVVSINDLNYRMKSCGWGMYIGNFNLRGQRLGARVQWIMMNFVFEHLNLHKMWGIGLSFNKRIITMQENYGFRREAFYREHTKKNGEWCDAIGIAMLRNEWRRLKDNIEVKIFDGIDSDPRVEYPKVLWEKFGVNLQQPA